MAFTTVLTTTTSVDDSIVLAFDQSFLIEASQNNVMDQFVSYKAEIGAKSIQFPIFSGLPKAITPLTEGDDVTSVALADAPVLITPAEYGLAVTTTNLANLQTGGKADMAAAEQVGRSMGETTNQLACLALDASTNVIFAGGKTEATLLATDVIDGALLGKAYNKLSRSNIGKFDGRSYIMIAHDDVVHDLRNDTAAGSWQDVAKYAQPDTVFKNEVGMYKGFRVIINNDATKVDQTGAGLIDMYNTYFIGKNALGLAVSQEPKATATGPFDKLGRFVNLGWHGTFQYKIVDPKAVWVAKTASSVGDNAA